MGARPSEQPVGEGVDPAVERGIPSCHVGRPQRDRRLRAGGQQQVHLRVDNAIFVVDPNVVAIRVAIVQRVHFPADACAQMQTVDDRMSGAVLAQSRLVVQAPSEERKRVRCIAKVAQCRHDRVQAEDMDRTAGTAPGIVAGGPHDEVDHAVPFEVHRVGHRRAEIVIIQRRRSVRGSAGDFGARLDCPIRVQEQDVDRSAIGAARVIAYSPDDQIGHAVPVQIPSVRHRKTEIVVVL